MDIKKGGEGGMKKFNDRDVSVLYRFLRGHDCRDHGTSA
jgi:hypothetical protein